MDLWWVGAIVAVFGSVGSNFGINIQKYAFMKAASLPLAQQLRYTRQPLWLLGLSFVIIGSFADFAALGLAAQSIIAPIASVTLVANLVFAHFWLKEYLSRRDLFGTFFIIVGSVVTVAFGDHTSVEYSISDIRNFFGDTLFICYAMIMFLWATGMYLYIRKNQPIKIALNAALRKFEPIKDAKSKDEMMKNDEELQLILKEYEPVSKALPFCYCSLSGVLGGQSILFGKMVAVLFATSLQGDNQMFTVFPYVFLASMLFFVFSQLHFLALALNFFDALYCVPIFECFFICVSALGGACFFGEFAHFDLVQSILFPLGIITTITGVYLLSDRDNTSGGSNGRVHDESTLGMAGGAGTSRVFPVTPATVWMSLNTGEGLVGQAMKFRVRSRSLGFKEQQQLHTRISLQMEQEQAAQLHKEGQLILPESVHKSIDEFGKRKTSVGGREEQGGTGTLNPGRKSTGDHPDASSNRNKSRGGRGSTGDRDELLISTGVAAVTDSPTASSAKQKRKVKSRSHPSQFTTPSCLLRETTGERLSEEGTTGGGGGKRDGGVRMVEEGEDEEWGKKRVDTTVMKAKQSITKNRNGLHCGGGVASSSSSSIVTDDPLARISSTTAAWTNTNTESSDPLPVVHPTSAASSPPPDENSSAPPMLRNHSTAELSCTPQLAPCSMEESGEDLSVYENSSLIKWKEKEKEKAGKSSASAGKYMINKNKEGGGRGGDEGDREVNSANDADEIKGLLRQQNDGSRRTYANGQVRVPMIDDSPLPEDHSDITMNLNHSISIDEMSTITVEPSGASPFPNPMSIPIPITTPLSIPFPVLSHPAPIPTVPGVANPARQISLETASSVTSSNRQLQEMDGDFYLGPRMTTNVPDDTTLSLVSVASTPLASQPSPGMGLGVMSYLQRAAESVGGTIGSALNTATNQLIGVTDSNEMKSQL